MSRPRYIYVAGPLSAPTPEGVEANCDLAMAVGARLRSAGLIPFVPHALIGWDKKFPADYETWLAYDFAWIGRCDALLRIAPSPGTDREVEHALRLRIAVYTDIDTLLANAKAAA